MGMMLNLTTEAQDILRETLESYISDLRMEVSNTDNYDFRQDLKHREAILKSIADQLRHAAAA